MIFRVIIIPGKDHFIILKLFRTIGFFILNQIKQTALNLSYNFTTYAYSRTPPELKNCDHKNPSLLFGPLTQYLGSDKRRALSPCVTNVLLVLKPNNV